MLNPKVLMFGWEFPPFKSGGLGTACHDLVKGLASFDTKVTFVMPSNLKKDVSFVDLVGVDVNAVESSLSAYAQPGDCPDSVYGFDLFGEVERYAERSVDIAKKFDFDVIHAHDWMTYKAGILAKKISGCSFARNRV